MPDIFDTLAPAKSKPQGDIFDQVAKKKPDIFDQLSSTPLSVQPAQPEAPRTQFNRFVLGPAKQVGAGVVSGSIQTGAALGPGFMQADTEGRLSMLDSDINRISKEVAESERRVSIGQAPVKPPGILESLFHGDAAIERQRAMQRGLPVSRQDFDALAERKAKLAELVEQRKSVESSSAHWKDATERWARASQTGWLEAPKDMSAPEWIARTVSGAVPSLGAAAVTTAVAGPTAGGLLLGNIQGVNAYLESRKAGMSVQDANKVYAAETLLSTLTEKIPLELLTKGIDGTRFVRAMVQGGVEGAQEVVDQIKSNLIASGSYDKDRKWYDDLLQSFVAGFGSGSIVSALSPAEQTEKKSSTDIPNVKPEDQAQAQELVAGGVDPTTVAAWSQAPDEATKQQILTDALAGPQAAPAIPATEQGALPLTDLKPPAPGQPTADAAALPADSLSTPPPVAAALSDDAALQAMSDDISRTRKTIPAGQFSVAQPSPDRAEEANAANQAAQMLGKKVVWFKNNDPKRIRFNGTVTGDTIFINVDTKNPYVKVGMHETLHRMKTEQPELYGKFLAVVKTEGSGFDQFREQLIESYKAQGISVDEKSDWVWEELAADTLGDRGQDKKFWSDLYEKSPDAVRAIVDTIQKVMATISGKAQTPEIAKYFNDFQKVHDAAVSVISEYAATRPPATTQAEAKTTPPGNVAVQAEVAATLPPSKKAHTGNIVEKVNPTLEDWRDLVKSAGVKPMAEGDLMGKLPPGVVRKDARAGYDQHLAEAVRMGLITEDEASDPATFHRLMTGENQSVKEAVSTETKAMLAQQEGELIDTLKRGGTVDDQAFKDFPAIKQYKDYGKSAKNPATVGGFEFYHDGSVWKIARPGGEFKEAKGALAERLDAAMPGVAEEKVPFSIDRDFVGVDGESYRDIPRMRNFDTKARELMAGLPSVPDSHTRLWRGNRKEEVGKNPSFTNALLGIAMPFREMYGGNLSYVDVPTADLSKYLSKSGAAQGNEFILSPELAKNATTVENKTPLSIDDDLTALFDEQYPEAEPKLTKHGQRIVDDPEYTEQAKSYAKTMLKSVRGLDEDADAAIAFIDQGDLSTARAKIQAETHGLKDSQAAVAAQIIHKTYDRLIRIAEKQGKMDEAKAIAKENDALSAWINEQKVEGGRLTNAWKYNLTTASWDTASGQAATFEGMIERSNEKHPEIKTVEEQLKIAQGVAQQAAKEAADAVLAQGPLKARIEALEADREVVQRRDEILAKQDKAGLASYDKDPTQFKPLKDKLAAIRKAGPKLAGKFAEKVKLSIESAKTKLSVAAQMLSADDHESIAWDTMAWRDGQKEAGKPATYTEWRAWAETTYGKGLFDFSDAVDIFKTSERLLGRIASSMTTGKRAPKMETIVRRGIKSSGTTINDIIYQTATQQDATLKTLTERLVNELGYSGKDAADLAVKLNSAFRDIMARRGQQILEAKYRERGTKPKGRTKNVLDDILKSIKLGALSNEAIKARMYDKYGLNSISPEAEAQIIRNAQKVADAMDANREAMKLQGYTDAEIDAMNETPAIRKAKEDSAKYMASQMKHGVNDLMWSYIHFSLLSGPFTNVMNFAANSTAMVGEFLTRGVRGIVSSPFDNGKSFQQFRAGLEAAVFGPSIGRTEFVNTLKTGFRPIRGNDKFDADPGHYNPFESNQWLAKHPGLKAPLVSVSRLLAATDMLAAMPLREMQSAMLAAQVAQNEGLTGNKAIQERVSELLGRRPVDLKKFGKVADSLGLKGIDRARHIQAMMEQSRAPNIREDAAAYSAWATFNTQKPAGLFGLLATRLNDAALTYSKSHPIIGFPFRSVTMFARIAANVTNNTSDYGPAGLLRALSGKVLLSNGKVYNMDEVYTGLHADTITKAAVGNLLMIGTLMLALRSFKEWKDDPEKDKKRPWFVVNGAGPKNPAMKALAKSAGDEPWSFRMGDGPVIKFKWISPISIPMAMVGLWMDQERYPDEDETPESHAMRLSLAMTVGMAQYVLQTSPVANLNTALRMLNEKSESSMAYYARQFVSGYTGFVVPNFVSTIEKMFDPKQYSANDVLSAIIRNIPFARRNLSPALNLFGDEIEYPPSERFIADSKSDPEALWLANNNLNISKPDRPVMVDPNTGAQHDITEEEYYKLVKYFGPVFRQYLRDAIPAMKNYGHDDKKTQVASLKKYAYQNAYMKLLEETGWLATTKEQADKYKR